MALCFCHKRGPQPAPSPLHALHFVTKKVPPHGHEVSKGVQVGLNTQHLQVNFFFWYFRPRHHLQGKRGQAACATNPTGVADRTVVNMYGAH